MASFRELKERIISKKPSEGREGGERQGSKKGGGYPRK